MVKREVYSPAAPCPLDMHMVIQTFSFVFVYVFRTRSE
jgi:hypothetical protein